MLRSIKGKIIYLVRIIRKRSGFTLIEVLVALVLFAILAAIALSFYMKYIENARVTIAMSTLDGVRKAFIEYQVDYGTFPASVNFSSCLDEQGHIVFLSGLCNKIKEDLYSEEYSYISGTSYILTARAKDKKHTLLTLTESRLSR